MLNAPLNVNLYERTLTSSVGTFIEDIAPKLSSYQHTITATCGFESMTSIMQATLLEAQRMCERLGCGCIVYGANADIAWEGFLAGVSYRIGEETISISLDEMANRVLVRFTTVNGVAGFTATASHTGSQAIYGIKDYAESIGTVIQAAAESYRDAILAERRLPRPVQNGAIGTGQADIGSVEVTLSFAGWYTTLGWVLTSRTDTTNEVTTTQVGALISGSSPGIGATNAFLSTSTARIATSAVSDTRKIDADTPYRDKIETLLAKGSGTERYAWGVYENRVFVVEVWAGATPTTITYRRRIGDALLESSAGALIMPWAVRPNAMLETSDLLNVGPPSGTIELPGRQFVERWTVDLTNNGWRITPEPAGSTSIDARLARMG